MNDLDCLSMMELLNVRAGHAEPDAEAHLGHCARCQALLSVFPAPLTLPDLSQSQSASLAPRPPLERPERMRTGQLWRAGGDESGDWTWVVVILGRVPDGEDRLLVVPVADDPTLASERDLLLDGSQLGYSAFADVANLGVLLEDQLLEYIGALERAEAEDLVELYRATLGDTEIPERARTGLPVRAEDDPRLPARHARGQALRALWRAADGQVRDEDESATAVQLETQPTMPSLAIVLQEHLAAAASDWDRQTLLEASGVEGRALDAFLRDELDLTDKRDVDDLARVLHILHIPRDDAETAVRAALSASAGGRREASGPTIPMAARSRPGASAQDVTDQLYGDQSSIDESAAARTSEINAYLAELRDRLNELE